MASPEVDALMALLNSAKADLEPQIRGMEDLLNVSLSDGVKNDIREELGRSRTSMGVIDQAIIACNNLNADGFPENRLREISEAALAELAGQMSDFEAAFNQFEAPPPASNVNVDLGAAVNNPGT